MNLSSIFFDGICAPVAQSITRTLVDHHVDHDVILNTPYVRTRAFLQLHLNAPVDGKPDRGRITLEQCPFLVTGDETVILPQLMVVYQHVRDICSTGRKSNLWKRFDNFNKGEAKVLREYAGKRYQLYLNLSGVADATAKSVGQTGLDLEASPREAAKENGSEPPESGPKF